MQSAGPSLTSADIPCLIHFLHSSVFHVLLPWIFYSFLIYSHFTWCSFQTVWPCYILSFLPSALPFERFYFGAQDHLGHLHIPSVLFLCWGNNPFCTLPTLLILHPCLLRIFSLFFCTLSSFPLLLQQAPHSTTMYPYICKKLLRFYICAVLFPSLSFSSYASVNLHPGVSTVLPLPYL